MATKHYPFSRMDFLDILAVLLCSKPHTINTKFICFLWSLSFVKVTQDFPGASSWDTLFLKCGLGTICIRIACEIKKKKIRLHWFWMLENGTWKSIGPCFKKSVNYSDADGPRRTWWKLNVNKPRSMTPTYLRGRKPLKCLWLFSFISEWQMGKKSYVWLYLFWVWSSLLGMETATNS